MCRRLALTSLLLLSVIAVASSQHFDILQGLQQLFQPYRGNAYLTQYNAVTRSPGTHRNTHRQENKKKNNNNRSQNVDRNIKKPPINQYEYVFATTTHKPSRKSTKSNSSQHNSSNISIKNQNSNLLLGDYLTPNFEFTTKANKVNRVKATSTTTAAEGNYLNNVHNNINNNRATTENVYNNMNNRGFNNHFNLNIPVTENVFENKNRKENFAVNNGYGSTDNVFDNQNNRQTDFSNGAAINNFNNNRNLPHSTNNNQRNNNRGIDNNNNYKGILNTEYDFNSPNLTPNNKDPNTYATINNPTSNNNRGIANNDRGSNNFSSKNTRLVNTAMYPNNFGSNTAITDQERPKNKVTANEYDRRVTNNNFGNTGTDHSMRGGSNDYSNNRGIPNSFNSNNKGRPNNFNSEDSSQITFPSDVYNNPLLNRPGVRPAPVDVGQQPITNKPNDDRNNVFNPRPSNPVTFNEEPDTEPKIYIGPDEDDMTESQKKRYVDLAERMCDRYKALTVKKVVALPLVPSPDPVELNVSSCTPVTAPLIIGGRVASIREFPHMALLGWMKIKAGGYSWKCGGSLVSSQYVLTAGHCTYQDKDYDVLSGPPRAVQLGSSVLDDPGALVARVAAVVRHPKYKLRRAYHDVALLRLRTRLSFSEVIRPACLGVAPPEGENIIAAGWGRTEFGGDHSRELRSVSLPIWNMEDCKEIWGTSLKLPNGVTPDSHVCAGDKRGGMDTCQGDSGGPALLPDGCAWRVVAVTSLGRSCGAANTPALYAAVPRAFLAAQLFSQDAI